MVTPALGRPVESKLITEFLTLASIAPAAMVIEGEAGIGKTTLWLAAIDSAAEAGFQVLAARPAQAESVLAYSALADMLDEVDDDAWTGIPAAQRLALDRMLLRGGADDTATDPRAVAAGFVSLVKNLEQTRPVLLAVDDLQWLDSSSLQVIAFAARRLSGRAGVLGTVRTNPDTSASTAWLQLPRIAPIHRIQLGPFTFGGLRAVMTEQLGRSLSRAAVMQIYEVSHGNPFYAFELARAMDEQLPQINARLPSSLGELVRARIGSLGTDVRTVLLAASCVSAPTVELLANATGHDAERVVGLLVHAEDRGIVGIDGHRVNYTHPLLARGVYSEATPAQRREMHRCLADIVEEPELQARHLAMAVGWGDPHALERLDRSAEIARMRGAPAAAAELLDLAVGLGGDTAERRIRLAGNHFEAGDSARARDLLEEIVADIEPSPLRAVALSLLGSVRAFGDSFTDGVELWQRSVVEAADNLALRVPTLVILALTQFSTGRLAEGVPTADQAVTDATRLGDPLLLSQALGVRVLIHFLRGEGIDEVDMQQALELETRPSSVTSAPGLQMVLSASLQHGLLLGWSGEFDRAHRELLAVRQTCVERGHEFEWMYVAYYSVQIEIWWGNFSEAAAIAEEAMNRVEPMGGDIGIGAALTMRAAVAAHAGLHEQARRDADEAIELHQRCGARMLAEWPIAILGFLELSLGQHEAALAALQPLLSRYAEGQFGTEIHVAGFVPDIVEALVHLGRLNEAEPLVEALERNGRRLDRPWMLAVGARGRSMLQGARGDVEAALGSAREAMRHHERVPMPFEKARTQLILGQLERRQRHREAATTSLREALAEFERLNTPLWAERARTELARTDVATIKGASGLTVSERRVAELAAKGMTNRDVAAKLFVSPKTVEANLVRIYRKLGIHSRAELGRLFGESDP